MQKEVLQKIETIVAPILDRLNYTLVDLELVFEGSQVLRIYIDKDSDNVTIDDCVKASHAIEDNLDAEDVITSAYRLEVSSPGLDRPLRKLEDYQRFQGHQIQIKTTEPINDRSNYKGDLIGANADQVEVLIDGMKYQVPLTKIAKARLVPDIIENKGKKRK